MGADFSSLPPCLGVPTGTSLPGVFPASLPAAFRPGLGHAARQRDGVRVRPFHLHHWSWPVFLSRRPALTPTPSFLSPNWPPAGKINAKQFLLPLAEIYGLPGAYPLFRTTPNPRR